MVRLVFRPYTHVGRTICTSVPLRTSTRVSPGFVLRRHSSPSFGSRRARSRSILHRGCGRRCWPCGLPPARSLSLRVGVCHPPARARWTPWSVFQDGSNGTVTPDVRNVLGPPPRPRGDGDRPPEGARWFPRPSAPFRKSASMGNPTRPRPSSLTVNRADVGRSTGRAHPPRDSGRGPGLRPPTLGRRKRGEISPADRGRSRSLPSRRFQALLTLFPGSFSPFPHGTCSLSVSRPYLALDGIYHPLRLQSQTARLAEHRMQSTYRRVRHGALTLRGAPFQGISALARSTRQPALERLQFGAPRTPDSRLGLFPLRSPLLGESRLVSFPPLINMLKFSG